MDQLKKLLATLALAVASVTGVQAACTDPAGPNVNWSGCNKNGIRVPGANLSGADLSKATFTPTAKYNADFSNANLSGANFTGSTVTGANFSGANLAGAKWTDGRVCATPSVGSCKVATAGTTPTTTPSAATGSTSGSGASSGTSSSGFITQASYESEFYWKKSYGRGVGTIPPLECESGKMQAGALCYDSCRTGYSASGLSCVQSGGCPSGYSDRGLTCHYDGQAAYSPVHSSSCAYRSARINWGFGNYSGGDCMPGFVEDNCNSGYSKTASMCYYTSIPSGMSGSALDPMKGSYQMANPKAMVQVCRDGKGLQDGLCYTPCRSEYNGVGPVCWSKPPANYLDCGMGAASSTAVCAKVISLQVASAVFLAAEFGPAAKAALAGKIATASAKSPKLAQSVAKEGPALIKTLETSFKELEPLTKEIDTAIKAGQDISGPVNSMMTKIIPVLLKSDVFINMLKGSGMAYGGYEMYQDNDAAKKYWSSIRSSDVLQLQIVRNVAAALSLLTGVYAIASPVPPPAIDPMGVLSGVFDVISNYTYPM